MDGKGRMDKVIFVGWPMSKTFLKLENVPRFHNVSTSVFKGSKSQVHKNEIKGFEFGNELKSTNFAETFKEYLAGDPRPIKLKERAVISTLYFEVWDSHKAMLGKQLFGKRVMLFGKSYQILYLS